MQKERSVEKYISIEPGTLQREGYSPQKITVILEKANFFLSARMQMQRKQNQC